MNIRNLFLSMCLVLVLGTVAQGARPTAANPNGGAFTYLPLVTNGTAQGDNANEWVPPYTGQFQYGLNPGYYGSNWSDEAIYQLCYDAGCRTARNTLPDYFLAQ
ncbi:MAG: hypothetical protein KC434_17650, partial [Anaerolineales bacterium]|nr:hypothetical protein [Anaerolineales bacterium]